MNRKNFDPQKEVFICGDCHKKRSGHKFFLHVPYEGEKVKICNSCIQMDRKKQTYRYPQNWSTYIKKDPTGFYYVQPESFDDWVREKALLAEQLKSTGDIEKIQHRIDVLLQKIHAHVHMLLERRETIN